MGLYQRFNVKTTLGVIMNTSLRPVGTGLVSRLASDFPMQYRCAYMLTPTSPNSHQRYGLDHQRAPCKRCSQQTGLGIPGKTHDISSFRGSCVSNDGELLERQRKRLWGTVFNHDCTDSAFLPILEPWSFLSVLLK